MKRFNSLLVFLLLIVSVTNVTNIYGQELVIFGNNSKPPKYYLENNIPKGILIDIMRYVETEIDISFIIELYPWKRAYFNALDKRGGIIGLSKNSERLKIFDYSDVMYDDELLLVVLKGNEFPFNSINDLKGKTIGVQRGASFGEDLEKGKDTLFEVQEDNTQVQRLKKLLAKRFDVALIGPGRLGVNMTIESDKELLRRKDEFVILDKHFKKYPNFLGFSKELKMEKFLKIFNQALEKGRKTGAIQKIIESYSN